MAVNTSLFTIAAAVAAIGAFCSFESHHHRSITGMAIHHNKSYIRPDGDSNGKANEKRVAARVAPQFDGLNFYETLVRH
uniref:Uncharacterized protein n=1 Tax=Picea sitchensis TaxID=3332 RepID=A9NR48_PICSI|nr:unknown [Picea sitchensis]